MQAWILIPLLIVAGLFLLFYYCSGQLAMEIKELRICTFGHFECDCASLRYCDSFSAVHVTDIHCAYEKVAQLKERLRKEQQKVDVVLISGDIANFPQEKFHKGDVALESEHHDNLLKVTAEFLSVAEKVYFIPGNVRD